MVEAGVTALCSPPTPAYLRVEGNFQIGERPLQERCSDRLSLFTRSRVRVQLCHWTICDTRVGDFIFPRLKSYSFFVFLFFGDGGFKSDLFPPVARAGKAKVRVPAGSASSGGSAGSAGGHLLPEVLLLRLLACGGRGACRGPVPRWPLHCPGPQVRQGALAKGMAQGRAAGHLVTARKRGSGVSIHGMEDGRIKCGPSCHLLVLSSPQYWVILASPSVLVAMACGQR